MTFKVKTYNIFFYLLLNQKKFVCNSQAASYTAELFKISCPGHDVFHSSLPGTWELEMFAFDSSRLLFRLQDSGGGCWSSLGVRSRHCHQEVGHLRRKRHHQLTGWSPDDLARERDRLQQQW